MKNINLNHLSKFNLLIFFLFQFGFTSEIFGNCEKVIKLTYPNLDSIRHEIWIIPPKIKTDVEISSLQRFFKPNLHIWEIMKDSSKIGYAILDNVIGKSMPISFLVLFNNSGEIVNTEIIKYREPYGGEISSENWLKQFKNKSSKSSFKIGPAVDGISGATISVHSVTKGIKKLALIFPYIFFKSGN